MSIRFINAPLFLFLLLKTPDSETSPAIETTGYRASCGGCTSFYVTGPVTVILTGAGGTPSVARKAMVLVR